jgi:hypothetical protein
MNGTTRFDLRLSDIKHEVEDLREGQHNQKQTVVAVDKMKRWSFNVSLNYCVIITKLRRSTDTRRGR